jgi:hypothetical protein
MKENEDNHIENLGKLRNRLGDNADFFPSDEEVDALVTGVEAQISVEEQVPETVQRSTPGLSWQRIAAVAAVVVLVIGTGFIGYRMGINVGPQETTADSQAVVSGDGPSQIVTADGLSLTDSEVDQLLREASVRGFGTAEELLGELSDEEVEYLMESFDVGELLL